MKHQEIYFWLAAHALLGYVAVRGGLFVKYYPILILIWGLFRIIKTKNRKGAAHLYAAYFMALEIFLKINRADLFWEFGKYSVILCLTTGLIQERRLAKRSKLFLLYLSLLLPGIFLMDVELASSSWRELVASTFSGPVSLTVSAVYFYKRPLRSNDFLKMVFIIISSLTATLVLLIRNFTQLENVTFGTESNLLTSGSYGPNQVSTALGLAVVIIFLANMLGRPITRKRLLDLGLSLAFLYFAFLTFSRGGVISALMTCFCTLLVSNVATKSKSRIIRSFIMLAVLITGLYQIWTGLNNYTEGALVLRYSLPKNTKGLSVVTGREEILALDIEIFKKHFLFGVGAGMGNWARYKYGMMESMSAHTEFTRMLAEHGSFGILALVIFFYLPISHFRKEKKYSNKLIFLAFLGYAFLTMAHSAMRLALPGFLYGLAFLDLQTDD